MADVVSVARPQRWDTPFGPDMTDADVDELLRRPEIASIDLDRFPAHTPLAGILRNDTRLVRFAPGDIVVREGDYGNSAFLILDGGMRVVIAPSLPRNLLGRQVVERKGFFDSVAQLWRNSWVPEIRDRPGESSRMVRDADLRGSARAFLQDIPAIIDQHRTASISAGTLFGELAALGRIQRTATVFAETDTLALEIRWQGLRELRKYDEGWRRQIDATYRANALKNHFEENALFKGLRSQALEKIVETTLFETYGSFDWHASYRQMRQTGGDVLDDEPVIAREGNYPDGLLLIRAGFARVSVKLGNGRRTLTYLGAGDHYGLSALYDGWKSGEAGALDTTLSALGYVDVLRVPAGMLEEHLFPILTPAEVPRVGELVARSLDEDALMEWAVEERYVNATQAMLIDLQKCTRCDDCVRACAATHEGNPRFIRHGRTFDNYMVANACMHCIDPVCLIGCPTGAIHRSVESGNVIINDDTCIGCATCANSCPYDNIRLVEIREETGAVMTDPETERPIMKATKCDLCEGQLGGPACVRACPHDAMHRIDFRELEEAAKQW
ncbi:MAG: 4Fe-4S dicluster domain-containing protein [Rhodospirillales bacterium]